MSYLVLARKYRPQTFDEIVGQEHVVQTLTNAIKLNRMHHAFLFTGARGVGKTTIARILAKALSCEKAPTPTPCNKCEPCKEIANGTSVDVQEIDAASNNGVDNIRELREAIRYAPVRGKKKVYILDEVHMLSGGAWNALLKTLEEPPPHAVFIFATTDPHKLPATILSRVQRYDYKLLASKRIVEYLKKILGEEKIKAEPAALQLIAREAAGSLRDALSLTDQLIASVGKEGLTEKVAAETLGLADRALVRSIAGALLQKNAHEVLSQVASSFEQGTDLVQLGHSLLGYLRDLVVVQTVTEPDDLIDASPTEMEGLRAQLKDVPRGIPELLFARLGKVVEEAARSAQPKWVLEVGLVEMTHVEPLEPLGALLQKLEALESRIESGGPGTTTGGGGSGKAPTKNAYKAADENADISYSAAPAPSAPGPAALAPTANAAPTPAPKPAPPRNLQNFTELIEAVIGEDARLSALAQSRLIKWEQKKKLVIGFDREFAAEGIRERLDLLRTTIKKLTSQELAIEVIVGADAKSPQGQGQGIASETLLEVEQRKVDEDRANRSQEAKSHPVRKLIDESFGGTWKDPVVDNVDGE